MAWKTSLVIRAVNLITNSKLVNWLPITGSYRLTGFCVVVLYKCNLEYIHKAFTNQYMFYRCCEDHPRHYGIKFYDKCFIVCNFFLQKSEILTYNCFTVLLNVIPTNLTDCHFSR